MPTLTVVDTLGIQAYVFASNRLRDAVAGSALVQDLPFWVRTVCPESDVLLDAGGNALLRFADEATARDAMARLSRFAWTKAPGLELLAVHRSYPAGSLATTLLGIQNDLQEAKLNRRP